MEGNLGSYVEGEPARTTVLVAAIDSAAAKEPVNLNEPQIPPSFKETRAKAIEQGHGALEEMDFTKAPGLVRRCSSPPVSEGSVLDRDLSLSSANCNRPPRVDSPSLQALASGAQHSENSAAYFLWPAAYRLHGSAEDRTAYFYGLQKDVDLEISEKVPSGPQAATLLDVMTIRAYHSKRLRRVSLGTAVGFRTRQGFLTNIPAIIVFVARKVHKAWLQEDQRLPVYLEGPGGVWCDVDVVEFSYYGTPAVTPKEQVYTELVEGLRGNDPCIGPGSQVASQETYGTLGAIVQSRTGACQVGFLTNRHVAVDLDYPNQKMFHPLPPNVGPGVYLGAVERATSFITDERWYSIFASVNPETFVRADGAFIPFGDSFDLSRVTTTVKGVGDMGDVTMIDLQAPINSVVGTQVVKVGRSSGLTKGSIMAYALEYNDEKGICFFTDFLIVGENKQAFDLEGDSGSLILMVDEGREKPRPVGIIWGGTANRGRLKLRNGYGPENWTSGVDLGRLLECLQLDLITSNSALEEAIVNQRQLASGPPTVGECCSSPVGTVEANQPSSFEKPLFKVQSQTDQVADFGYLEDLGRVEINPDVTLAYPRGLDGEPIDFMRELDFGIRHVDKNKESEHREDLLALRKVVGCEDLSFSLNLSDKDAKCRWL